MKSIFKICLLAAFIISAGFVNAQSLKFGHIDTQQLMSIMPETKNAEAELQKIGKELEDQRTEIAKLYNEKLQTFQTKGDSLSEIARTNLITEIQDIEQRAQNFQKVAQQQFSQKQSELMKPIVEKINETIEAVAKEQALIYVFDIQPGTPVLYKSNQSIDLLPLCKAKLGIQ